MGELTQMRLFARVVEAGSFSEAGRQLGVAPSSVSRQVSDHEDMLGVRLFNRTTRKLSVTEAGDAYYVRVREILDGVEDAKLAAGAFDGKPTGVLRVTAPSGIGRQLLAAALPEFLSENPAIKIVLDMSDRQLDIVDTGIDVAIRVGSQPDSTLKARKIGASKRVLCASPGYLDAFGDPKHPSQLEEHNCLTWRGHPGANLWRFKNGGKTVTVRATGNLYAQSADALSAAAVAGLGVVLLPDWNIGAELRDGSLRFVLPEFKPEPAFSPVYAVLPPQKEIASKTRTFIDFISKRLGAPAYAERPPRKPRRRRRG